MKKRISLFMALVMMLTMCVIPASALSYGTRASDYFDGYNAYIVERSNGDLRIYFEVCGTGTMTTIGTSVIYLYCDGIKVATFTRSTDPQMCDSNTAGHGGYVTYTETESNSEYYAYVQFYAKNSSGSETRGYYTATINT